MIAPVTVSTLLREAVHALAAVSPTPRLDAEVLLADVLGSSRAGLIRDAGEPVPAAARQAFAALLQRRANGEPVAYLTGRREFWSLDLTVTPAVLDPRADTETLVEVGLRSIAALTAPRVLELGTGSGAVALALACERPDAHVTATDRSEAALAVARDNAQRLAPGRLRLLVGDWFAAVEPGECFELILSNPPYLADDDPHLAALRHEPRSALVAEGRGLADLERLIRGAPAHLAAGGWLWLEHGETQGAAVRERLRAAGYVEVATHRDAAGRERVSGGRRR